MPVRRRRRIKYALIRSRVPFRGALVRGYLRGMERYRSWQAAPDRQPELGGVPVPPPRLRVLGAGTTDLDLFINTGNAQAKYIRDLLAGVGRPLDEMDAILDFGCGCGRIARW